MCVSVCLCVCVCVCVCVSKKKNADENVEQKMSVEHGDLKKLKIIPDSRIRTDLRGCTDPYELRIPEFVR